MAKLSGVFLCATLVLNEDFGPIKIIAAILVMAGLLINVFGGKLMKQFFRKKLAVSSM
jgi:drug/metabolite transporter (DMT)-like permease